ncbi:MAG: NAD(P)-dependent oxidoreductase [Aquamicrobium sp.]|uniref:NAD(P)-dependent oxidoreductase n=1 Tax=Aquamicrobium sp. TaxID=1872579 RepID=UPI00349EF936|nr:NAD(P)-dependent oxidoreductase [Aquamicrobium sp.]
MKIGFLGAGKMGLPIACNIARKTGGPLAIYDPRPPVLPAEAGDAAALLSFVPAIGDLSGCDVVVLCLPDSKVVSAVVEGAGGQPGLIDVLRPGSVVVDCSSSIPSETTRLAALLAAKEIGLHDAPVSGGLVRAWKGELTIMAGGIAGDSPLLDVLGCFASKIVRLDRVGDGHVMKAANNYLLAANIVSFTEALRFARTAGISFEKFGEVVNSSSGASYVSANKLETVRRDDDSVSFTSALITKDVRNFIESCERAGLDLPMVPRVLEIWEGTVARVGPDVDSMKIYHTLGGRAS